MAFTHPCFRIINLDDLPLNRDLYLMDEVWLAEWEAEYIKLAEAEGDDDDEGGDPHSVGYISRASATAVSSAAAELCWYPNTHDRFHEVKTVIPRTAIVSVVEAWNYDKRPTIFVRSEWLRTLHLRSYSVFAMIDAANMTREITSGRLNRGKLVELRDRIDDVAAHHPDISFISFADSILIKTNWFVGMVGSGVKYSYEPEKLLMIFAELQAVYRAVLDLEIYCVLAQGSNEFYDDALTHTSPSGNHISLNSLGLPFAQIMLIENAARKAIGAGEHGPHELYMDDDFFYSLRFENYDARELVKSGIYKQKMSSAPGRYFFSDSVVLRAILKS
jgi:hypothetical protein